MSQPTLMSFAAERAERAAVWAARMADGRVPAEQHEEFQAWLDADPLNGEALEEIVGAWRAVEHYAASPQIVALREAALASARKTLHRRERKPPSRGLIWALVAATLMLMVGGAGVWVWITPRTYETGVGERRVVALSDGSKVSLDGATVVRVSYTRANRRLWLDRGRAKFEVAKDPLRPFSVAAADKVVVATGTAFSVELVRKQVRVVLYEGRVALLEQTRGQQRRPVAVGARQVPAEQLLLPGRELIMAREQPSRAETVTTVAEADLARSLSWEAGLLVFEDEMLGVVIEQMNRYGDTPLTAADDATARLRISGVVRAGDTDALVQGLATAFGVQASANGGAITLSKTPVANSAD